MLKLGKVAKSSYFYEISTYTRIDKDEDIKQVISEIFNYHKGRYGYPRITLELKNLGYKINHKKVQRIMKVLNLKAKKCKGKYKSYKGEVGKTCNNFLLDKVIDQENNKTYYKRNFETTQVNQKWSTDVSEFHISSGKLYLSPIIDMNNREIISYSISKSPNY